MWREEYPFFILSDFSLYTKISYFLNRRFVIRVWIDAIGYFSFYSFPGWNCHLVGFGINEHLFLLLPDPDR